MSKLAEAAGLLGFDSDDPSTESTEGAGDPPSEEGQLAAAEDLMAAVKGESPRKVLDALRALMDLMS